jgi:hypothetical protein
VRLAVLVEEGSGALLPFKRVAPWRRSYEWLPRRSTQAEVPGNEQHDDDEADEIDDSIHGSTPRASHWVDHPLAETATGA